MNICVAFFATLFICGVMAVPIYPQSYYPNGMYYGGGQFNSLSHLLQSVIQFPGRAISGALGGLTGTGHHSNYYGNGGLNPMNLYGALMGAQGMPNFYNPNLQPQYPYGMQYGQNSANQAAMMQAQLANAGMLGPNMMGANGMMTPNMIGANGFMTPNMMGANGMMTPNMMGANGMMTPNMMGGNGFGVDPNSLVGNGFGVPNNMAGFGQNNQGFVPGMNGNFNGQGVPIQ